MRDHPRPQHPKATQHLRLLGWAAASVAAFGLLACALGDLATLRASVSFALAAELLIAASALLVLRKPDLRELELPNAAAVHEAAAPPDAAELLRASAPGRVDAATPLSDSGPAPVSLAAGSNVSRFRPPLSLVRDAPAERKDSKVVPFADAFVRHRARVRGLRILVVADGTAARGMLLRILERAGHSPVSCEHVDDGLCVIAAGTADAVVVDLQQPEEFLSQALVLEAGARRTPLLVATDADAAAMVEQGASYALVRPLDASALLEALAASVGADKPLSRITAAPSAEALDMGVLGELDELGLGRDFVRVFALQCLRDAQSCVERADSAAAAGQWGLLHEECHALKGVASNMGAKGVAESASEVMALPSWRLAREWKQRAPGIRRELDRIANGLDAALAQLGRKHEAEAGERGAEG